MGFFRLLTTVAVMGDEAVFELRTQSATRSPEEWTDAYLAAFAELCQLRLVTFDKALAGKARGSVLLG